MSHTKFDNEQSFLKELNLNLYQTANDCIEQKASFLIGISGGSVLGFIDTKDIDNPSLWKTFLIDERYVPVESAESNFFSLKQSAYKNNADLQKGIGIIDTKMKITQCAQNYEKTVFQEIKKNQNKIDLIVMGVGPDGHIASLFPGHPALRQTRAGITTITDSPKPPANRISFTFPLILNSKKIFMILYGTNKIDTTRRILEKDKSIPAGHLYAIHPNCHLFIYY